LKQRSKCFGVCTAALGLALAIAPMTAASAKSKHHSGKVKGSNPKSAMCQDVKSEQSSSSSVGLAIEKAMTSGNFASAKQAMLAAYSTDLADVNKALGVIKSAPPNVQAAFKALLGFETQLRTDIQNSTSLAGLATSFESLGNNPKLVSEGTTISNWYTSVCGGTPITATTETTVSIP
jgi:hypothetical protein